MVLSGGAGTLGGGGVLRDPLVRGSGTALSPSPALRPPVIEGRSKGRLGGLRTPELGLSQHASVDRFAWKYASTMRWTVGPVPESDWRFSL